MKKDLYDFLRDLQYDDYAYITLKIGDKFVDIVEGRIEELINSLSVNMWSCDNYDYVIETSYDFVTIYRICIDVEETKMTYEKLCSSTKELKEIKVTNLQEMKEVAQLLESKKWVAIYAVSNKNNVIIVLSKIQ